VPTTGLRSVRSWAIPSSSSARSLSSPISRAIKTTPMMPPASVRRWVARTCGASRSNQWTSKICKPCTASGSARARAARPW
jgi:hypothetical protein